MKYSIVFALATCICINAMEQEKVKLAEEYTNCLHNGRKLHNNFTSYKEHADACDLRYRICMKNLMEGTLSSKEHIEATDRFNRCVDRCVRPDANFPKVNDGLYQIDLDCCATIYKAENGIFNGK